MDALIAMIRDHWREQDFPPAAGATEAEVAAFEGKRGVRLPPDVRAYFAWANGMADYLDYEYAEFLVFQSLDQVRPLADSAPGNAERAWAGAGRPAAEIASYFWFADVCYTRLVYAVRLSGGPSAVVVLDQTDYDAPRLWQEAESFAAFLRAYAGGGITRKEHPMIPKDIRESLLPELAAPGEDVPRVELACGVALKFTVDEETISRAEFGTWGVSIREAGEVAGDNAVSYIQWVEAEEGVFVNSDHCWPALVLAPATFIEHNGVPGRPVVYVVDERTAILTGADCPAGLARIREAMRGGLGACAMALNWDRKTWSRFYVHDATAIDLPRVTITGRGKGEGRYRRQSGPPGHYGHVILEVEPYVGAYDYLFVWAVDKETIPSEFREAVWEGVQGFATDYFRETGPLVGIRVTITGGSYHEVDSHAASFRVAATIAFKNAVMPLEVAALPVRRREQDGGGDS